MCRMEIRMHNAESLSAGQIEEFLAGTSELEIEAVEGADVYSWIKRVLVGQDYHRQGKKGRGRLRRYIMGVSGRSRAQVNRLIRQDNGDRWVTFCHSGRFRGSEQEKQEMKCSGRQKLRKADRCKSHTGVRNVDAGAEPTALNRILSRHGLSISWRKT